MAFKDWFSRKTPLQLALERGTQPGADLSDEMRNLRNYSIKSQADAEAICNILKRLASKDSFVSDKSALRAIVGLFQDVENTECPAFSVMAGKGIDLLIEIVSSALSKPTRWDDDDVLFALKILAMYGTRAGTDLVIRAARQPLRPVAFMWSVILQAYAEGHPECQRIFDELSDPLPRDFLAVALLDCGNAAKMNGAAFPHPFDSPAGKKQLESWLTDAIEDNYSYAVSATAALPWINGCDPLIALALDHPSPDVQIEAAWAAAKLGRDAGVRWLSCSCLDVNLSDRAKRYLNELGRADAIPVEAEDASFRAKAEFAQWLAHPNELGRPPDELEIVDQRVLNWPPEYEPKPFWLMKYRIKDQTGLKDDDVGVGLVGSITFCLFSYKLEQRPPEDSYAIHCYWEMTAQELIAETDVPEQSTEYDRMLWQFSADDVGDVRIIAVAEPSPKLKYPQKIVALAKAKQKDQAGWIVLDGPRSRWYPATDLPADTWDKTVLMVHVGRTLLGFEDEPNRQRFVRPATEARAPEQIIAAYERILNQARLSADQAKKLLGRTGVLGSAFPDYVSALATLQSKSKAACTSAAYEAILAAASNADGAIRAELFDSFTPLGENFERYVDALIELGRQAEIPGLIETFRPHWEHNLGYGYLGAAAFKSGYDQIAERFLVTLRHSLKDWCRCEEMGFLAEIWKNQGRADEAHQLLIDALKGLLEQSREAKGSDCALFEEWFQTRRSTYLRLFPDRGEAELRRLEIPSSTFAQA